jgi:hypothetical protein
MYRARLTWVDHLYARIRHAARVEESLERVADGNSREFRIRNNLYE